MPERSPEDPVPDDAAPEDDQGPSPERRPVVFRPTHLGDRPIVDVTLPVEAPPL